MIDARDQSPAQEVDLREYLRVLSARKWLILGCALLVLAAALAFSFQQTPVYSAVSRLLVKPAPDQQFPNVATEAQVVDSDAVAQRVSEELDADVTVPELLENVTADPVAAETGTGNTEVIEVTYTSSDPALAADAANAFATGYIEYRRERALAGIQQEEATLQQQIDDIRSDLERVSIDIEQARERGDAATAATLEAERSVLSAQLGSMQQQLDALAQQSLGVSGGDVLEPATQPSSPTSPNHMTNGLLGAVLGLLLGVGIAFLRERLEDRFKSRQDVERALHTPVLATIPRFAVDDPAQRLIVLADPTSAASEAYRNLRTNLEFTTSQREIRSVLVTSPSASEGKTSTAANLAVTLANAGRSVVLVSADLRKPTLEEFFGLSRATGLSGWLLGDFDEVANSIQSATAVSIDVVTSGSVPHNPAELLTSMRLRELIQELEDKYDLVLIDSPPVLPVADTMIIAPNVGAAILVLDASATHRSAGVQAKEQLERVGTPVIGCVLNAVDLSGSSYYYQPYSYGYRQDDDRGRKGLRLPGLRR